MKIKYQLWLIFSTIFVIVNISIYIVISNTYEKNLQAGYQQISIAQVATNLPQLKGTFPHSPKRSIGYLQTYSEQFNSRLIMLDHEKKVFADSYQQLNPNTVLNLSILNKDHLPTSLFSKTKTFGYVQHTLIPFQTIEAEGYLLIVQEADQLYADLKSFQNWMVQVLFIAVLAFFFISYFASNWFSKPIRQITFQLTKITPDQRAFYMKHGRRDEIKELVDAIQSMVSELNLYDERQRQFLSTSSHELKTPLTTMQLIVENLPYVREEKETYREFVQDLSFQVQKMKQMIDQLIQINRKWDIQLQKEFLSDQDIQKHLLQSFQHMAHSKQLALNFELEPVNLYVDGALFLTGLDNLVSNSIRYSPQGGVVNIGIKSVKEEIKISVCDNGIGILPEDLPHIFEPFYRSNEATAWDQEGSGLGLTIVKQVIEMHKGRIEIDTLERQGTCIHMFLPKM